MTIVEKLRLKFPKFIQNAERAGIEITTQRLDSILDNSENYTFKHTKIYSDNTYESILNVPSEVEKNYYFEMLRSLGKEVNEKEEKDSFFEEAIPNDRNFSCEISGISDVFIAHILNYMLEQEDSYSIHNLWSLLPRMIFENDNKPFKTIEDYILYRFKYNFITLKIKSKEKHNYKFFKEIKNSYLFEYMCKYNLPITTQRKEQNKLFTKLYNNRRFSFYNKEKSEINPERKYNAELIIHFKKAMTTEDISTKYLAFYHILEYFFDTLYNQNIVESVKSWFRDPQIDLSDDQTILEWVESIRKFKGKSIEDGQGNEAEAFKFVLKQFVVFDKFKAKLKMYTKDRLLKDYGIIIAERDLLEFYKRNTVDYIGEGLKIDFSNDETIIKTIQKRVYAIRNSLVHSKDSYIFKSFNPYDDETTLKKEIFLIKLLAIEIITESSENI